MFHTPKLVVRTLAVSLALFAGQAFAQTDLSELMDRPAYSASWRALFAGEKHVDRWLARYAATKDGTVTPTGDLRLGKTRYQISTVCKPHDCGSNFFVVLFSPQGRKAWGLLRKNEKTERFFGRPDARQKKALREAAQP